MKKRRRMTTKPERRNVRKAAHSRRSSGDGKDKKIAQLTRERDEALEQQTATSEVLQVISSSRGDLQPVFASLLANAVRICDATFGNVYRWDGDILHLLATHNTSPAFAESRRRSPYRPDPKAPVGRAIATKTLVNVIDLAAEWVYTEQREPAVVAAVELGGVRTFVAVPLLKENELIGIFTVYRQDVRPFSDKQIDLLKSFAAQAVIAIDNTRLLNELRDSLQQQTATADVLKVISRSTFDLQTVLNTLVESATRLCDSDGALIWRPKEGRYYLAASCGLAREYKAQLESLLLKPDGQSIVGRTLQAKKIVHLPDLELDPQYSTYDPKRLGGWRAMLGVPLMREGLPVGVMMVGQKTPRAFTDAQIALVATFADQAVIAIENVRLFDEVQAKTRDLSEALIYQTESGNILRVIASSPTDVGPVLKAIVDSACELCDAYDAAVLLKDGDDLLFSAHHGPIPIGLEKWPINRNWTAGRALLDRKPVHLHDLLSAEGADFPDGRELSRRMGHRSILSVPLLREGESVGVIVVRRSEVHPFSDKQIALLQTFADQAVIAIENVRLFDDVQKRTADLSEALEQQTATSEVLKVISASQGELEPVFKAMLENATRLCEARYGTMWLREGDAFRAAALHGPLPSAYIDLLRSGTLFHPSPDTPTGRVAQTRQPVQVPDLSKTRAYLDREPVLVAAVEVAGIRTMFSVPMLKEDELVGTISIYRQEILPFTDKQIDLVENFAAQAVIAIENTRLLKELRQRTDDLSESLEQQTATSEVLRVISSSPGELEPVFQTMLANATRVCEAKFGTMYRYDNDAFHPAATLNTPPAFAEYVQQRGSFLPPPGTPLDRLLRTKEVIRTADDSAAETPSPSARLAGAKSHIAVPMFKNDELAGAIVIYRQEVRPFTDKQVELVQNFAAQAVIAIENTRLLKELRQRTDDLSESLEQQTATSEVLKVISSSPGELTPVFKAMLENAVRICEAKFGTMFMREGDAFRAVALHNAPPAYAELRRCNRYPSSPAPLLGSWDRQVAISLTLDQRLSRGRSECRRHL